MKEVEKLLNLKEYKIIKIEERSEKKEMKKIIYLESKNKNVLYVESLQIAYTIN